MNARPSFTSARTFLEGEGRWRSTVAQAVGRLEQIALGMGVQFVPCDPEGFVIERDAAGIPGPLNPRYDYRRSRLFSRNFVSFVGKRDGGGISTQAGRLYTWTGGATLASEARALRIIYDHPDDARHTDYSIFAHPIADRIHGRVAYNGAVFVREDLRKARDELGGIHLAQVISPLSRLAALYLFDVDWCIATTKAKLFLNGTADRYGWAGISGGVDQHIEGIGGERDHYLMWSRRDDMLAEAERICAEGLKVAA